MAAISTGLRFCFAICLLLFGCGYALAQQVVVERESQLLAEPRSNAAVVATLKQGTTAQQTGKQGSWIKVTTGAGSGWLLSFNVRFGTGQASGSGSGAGAGLGRLFTPSQKPSVSPTIGIRGLDAEDLKAGNYNAQQMSLLDKYAVSKQEGENAARASGLAAVRLEYFK